MADIGSMVATSHNGRRTARGGRSKDKADTPDASAASMGIGDLGTIQSILLGEFSSQAEVRFTALESRIVELEAELATARGAHADTVREHNQALGQVKADLTRTKKSSADLFEEQDERLKGLQSSSVDRAALGDALRSIADLLTEAP